MKATSIDAESLKKKKFKGKTPLQIEKLQNLEADQDTAEVLETGQENEVRGKKAVAELETINMEVKRKQEEQFLSDLQGKKKFNASYKELLAKTLSDYLMMLDWIKGWQAHVVITDGSPIQIKGHPFKTKNGILLVVTTPNGRVFHQGMLTTNDPVLDYAAVMNLSIQTENQLDMERGALLSVGGQRTNLPFEHQQVKVNNTEKKSDGGIILHG